MKLFATKTLVEFRTVFCAEFQNLWTQYRTQKTDEAKQHAWYALVGYAQIAHQASFKNFGQIECGDPQGLLKWAINEMAQFDPAGDLAEAHKLANVVVSRIKQYF